MNRRGSVETIDDDDDSLDEVTFKELLGLNLPDWQYVVVGISASALYGMLLPVASILLSRIVEVEIVI